MILIMMAVATIAIRRMTPPTIGICLELILEEWDVGVPIGMLAVTPGLGEGVVVSCG